MPPFAPPQSQDGSAWEPPAADSRLAKTAGASPSGVFTSDLSVSEYVLLGEAGFEPLGFVVGSSIYHVGLQVGRWGRNQELQVLTQAMYNAREFAMARMRAEADHLGADRHRRRDGGGQEPRVGRACDRVATGTAVRRLPPSTSCPRPPPAHVHPWPGPLSVGAGTARHRVPVGLLSRCGSMWARPDRITGGSLLAAALAGHPSRHASPAGPGRGGRADHCVSKSPP